MKWYLLILLLSPFTVTAQNIDDKIDFTNSPGMHLTWVEINTRAPGFELDVHGVDETWDVGKPHLATPGQINFLWQFGSRFRDQHPFMTFADTNTFQVFRQMSSGMTPKLTLQSIIPESSRLYSYNADPNGSGNYLTILGNGYVGIGTTSPAEKLHVSGGVRIDSLAGTGFSEVVVDSSGTLQRQSDTKVGFGAYLASNEVLDTLGETPLDTLSELFDNGNNFDPINGVFTVPSDGLYHFDLNVGVGSFVDLSDVIIILNMLVNGGITTGGQSLRRASPIGGSYFHSISFSRNFNLSAGDAVTFTITRPTEGDDIIISGGFSGMATTITGFRVH